MRRIEFYTIVLSRRAIAVFFLLGIIAGGVLAVCCEAGGGYVYDLNAPRAADKPRESAKTAASPDSASAQQGKININTAGVKELDSLPGVGEKLAERIIAFREEKHPFGAAEEIMDVAGIGKKKYEAVKELICTE